MSGRVTLVGAGPGDPELLTLKAVRATDHSKSNASTDRCTSRTGDSNATGLQGITAPALLGNASNARALEAGKRARPLAEQAWALALSLGR